MPSDLEVYVFAHCGEDCQVQGLRRQRAHLTFNNLEITEESQIKFA